MAQKKKRARAKQKPTASAVREEAVAPTTGGSWARWVYGALGGYFFLCAGLLWMIARPASFADHAWWFMAAFVVVGAIILVEGMRRLRSKATLPTRLDQLYPPRFFLESWKQMDEEAAAERQARRDAGLGWDWRPLVALVVGAVGLTLMEYFGGKGTYDELVDWMLEREAGTGFFTDLQTSVFATSPGGRGSLHDFVWWSGWRVFGYFLMPVIALKLTGQRIRDQGLETRGLSEHAWIYGFAFMIVLTNITLVSYTAEFSTYYPFYKLATRSWFEFICWEILYAAQFFSLEFFFRGFWLKALKPMMGSHAIFAMVVPYCMIHYGKPFPETMAAIAAGIFLGTLAMKTRSIWSGFMIHVSVAISMDIAALMQTTGMPDIWYPG